MVNSLADKLVRDILWSDPAKDDNELGCSKNYARDPTGTEGIVRFGADVVREFLQTNGLSKIVRAHECIMDGVQMYANSSLFTVFSATDYCGMHKNAGGILCLTANKQIVPKVIYPQNLSHNNWFRGQEPTPPRWVKNY